MVGSFLFPFPCWQVIIQMAMKGKTATSLLLAQLILGINAIRFSVINNCPYSTWIGANPALGLLTFEISPGVLFFKDVDDQWRGQLFFRTHCGLNSNLEFDCAIGECGFQECDGKQPEPPITTLNFLGSSNDSRSFYSYSVNLEHGFNVPAIISPQGEDSCQTVGCSSDLNKVCPQELQSIVDGNNVAGCNSDCEGFRKPEYCCTGAFSGRDACKPSRTAQIFKQNCPQAHTWTYDDGVVLCAAKNFTITLCP